MRLQTEKETESLESLLAKANDQALAKKEIQQTALTASELDDKDFLRKMCTEELAAIVRNNNGDIKGVPAINALWDRIDGKPGQSVTLDATVRQITVNASVKFVNLPSGVDRPIIEHVDNVQTIE